MAVKYRVRDRVAAWIAGVEVRDLIAMRQLRTYERVLSGLGRATAVARQQTDVGVGQGQSSASQADSVGCVAKLGPGLRHGCCLALVGECHRTWCPDRKVRS